MLLIRKAKLRKRVYKGGAGQAGRAGTGEAVIVCGWWVDADELEGIVVERERFTALGRVGFAVAVLRANEGDLENGGFLRDAALIGDDNLVGAARKGQAEVLRLADTRRRLLFLLVRFGRLEREARVAELFTGNHVVIAVLRHILDTEGVDAAPLERLVAVEDQREGARFNLRNPEEVIPRRMRCGIRRIGLALIFLEIRKAVAVQIALRVARIERIQPMEFFPGIGHAVAVRIPVITLIEIFGLRLIAVRADIHALQNGVEALDAVHTLLGNEELLLGTQRKRIPESIHGFIESRVIQRGDRFIFRFQPVKRPPVIGLFTFCRTFDGQQEIDRDAEKDHGKHEQQLVVVQNKEIGFLLTDHG